MRKRSLGDRFWRWFADKTSRLRLFAALHAAISMFAFKPWEGGPFVCSGTWLQVDGRTLMRWEPCVAIARCGHFVETKRLVLHKYVGEPGEGTIRFCEVVFAVTCAAGMAHRLGYSLRNA